MQSKRDQVQAHMFVMGRLNSGMLSAEPDAPESPLARTSRGMVFGIVIALLLCAGAFVYGLLSPGGNNTWRSGTALVVNKDTGARYLYLDGRLRPVRNYASARLLLGEDLTVASVGTRSLADTPVGTPVGIEGAPDSVPGRDRLEQRAWRVCSTAPAQAEDGGGPNAARFGTVLTVGGDRGADRPLNAGEAALLKGPDDTLHLMWRGSRLRLDEDHGAVASLGYGSATPRPVTAAFLDSLPAGPDLTPPAVPHRGDAGPALGGQDTRVGQLFKVQVPGGDPVWHVLADDGLRPLTETAAALLLGDPRTRTDAYDGEAPRPRTLTSDVLGSHLAAGGIGSSAALPEAPPRLTDLAADALCSVTEPGDSDGTKVSGALVPTAALAPLAQHTEQSTTPACYAVQGIVVPPRHGALVRVLGAAGRTLGDTTYLVTESGVKYRVTDETALKALGYGAQDAVQLPSPLLAMLPTGPDLSQAAATGSAQVRTTTAACGGRT
ncbi:type VII secretion protein EccB [Streptomyces sp. NPDC059862]|uniref:type VII secretion protein EccB n=1 Tax=unclassified Streptomyces TaxID=2593676 RepID=UPI0036411394